MAYSASQQPMGPSTVFVRELWKRSMARSRAASPRQLTALWGGGREKKMNSLALSHSPSAKLKHKAKGAAFPEVLQVWEANFLKIKALDTK